MPQPNARLTFSDLNANGKIEQTTTATNEVLQENHYYPFGLSMNGAWINSATALDNLYQYNGKELNSDWGLNLYDYGFRWSDQALGRFISVDPLAEKFTELTTYQYASNTPVQDVDLDGLEMAQFNSIIQSVAVETATNPEGTVSQIINSKVEFHTEFNANATFGAQVSTPMIESPFGKLGLEINAGSVVLGEVSATSTGFKEPVVESDHYGKHSQVDVEQSVKAELLFIGVEATNEATNFVGGGHKSGSKQSVNGSFGFIQGTVNSDGSKEAKLNVGLGLKLLLGVEFSYSVGIKVTPPVPIKPQTNDQPNHP